jgi:hypothetical protein
VNMKIGPLRLFRNRGMKTVNVCLGPGRYVAGMEHWLPKTRIGFNWFWSWNQRYPIGFRI